MLDKFLNDKKLLAFIACLLLTIGGWMISLGGSWQGITKPMAIGGLLVLLANNVFANMIKNVGWIGNGGNPPGENKQMGSKILNSLLLFIFFSFALCLSAASQQPEPKQKFGAFGVGFSENAEGKTIGWDAIGLQFADRTLSYTSTEFSAIKEGQNGLIFVAGKPLQMTVRQGIAFEMLTINDRFRLYALADAGITATGENVVGSYAGGGFIDWEFAKGIGVLIALQADKNSIRGTEFNPKIGLRFKL